MNEIINVIIDELNTIIEYKSYEESAECDTCKHTIHDITMEEWIHVGEGLGVIKLRHPDVWEKITQGIGEVEEESTLLQPLI